MASPLPPTFDEGDIGVHGDDAALDGLPLLERLRSRGLREQGAANSLPESAESEKYRGSVTGVRSTNYCTAIPY